MLPALSNIPQSPEDWRIFSFNNLTSHRKIIAAINAMGGAQLQSYDIEPINPKDLAGWMYRHQAAHSDFNGVLKLSSNDLYTADFDDPKQLASWIALHHREHLLAEGAISG